MHTEEHSVPAAAAGTWTLGDLPVRRIGLGAMRLPQTGAAFDPAAAPRDRDQALHVLRRAVELGVNHIDTAAFYFSATRSANELINRALSPYRDDLVVVTKVGPGRDPSGSWTAHAATPAELRGQVEENLRQLGRDHLDVVNLRILGDAPIAERFGALAELRQQGLIRHLGLSNIRAHHLDEAEAIAPVVCVQNLFGLGATTPEQEALLRTCGERGVAFVPFYSIAGSGRERGGGLPEHDSLRELAQSRGVSTAQLRIAWTLHQGPHVLAIPGTGDPAHLDANVAAAGLRLSPPELAVLESAHRAGAR
ncbi:aldo/keto reductase [Streptacidiphilus jiangxiensis]|uniref:Predicted oxidoreductase n=1 Tax=Streptacidiphilus jiangxiensis TaxID=235985 RepID=A0A1H7HV90_STRJI|nr:aldo/keto reductase [Streptacidiphilus jiangxiensis]SEK54034.1 Predicted oxidoreductase [Streptacidiphilus jiangxiensis]